MSFPIYQNQFLNPFPYFYRPNPYGYLQSPMFPGSYSYLQPYSNPYSNPFSGSAPIAPQSPISSPSSAFSTDTFAQAPAPQFTPLTGPSVFSPASGNNGTPSDSLLAPGPFSGEPPPPIQFPDFTPPPPIQLAGGGGGAGVGPANAKAFAESLNLTWNTPEGTTFPLTEDPMISSNPAIGCYTSNTNTCRFFELPDGSLFRTQGTNNADGNIISAAILRHNRPQILIPGDPANPSAYANNPQYGLLIYTARALSRFGARYDRQGVYSNGTSSFIISANGYIYRQGGTEAGGNDVTPGLFDQNSNSVRITEHQAEQIRRGQELARIGLRPIGPSHQSYNHATGYCWNSNYRVYVPIPGEFYDNTSHGTYWYSNPSPIRPGSGLTGLNYVNRMYQNLGTFELIAGDRYRRVQDSQNNAVTDTSEYTLTNTTGILTRNAGNYTNSTLGITNESLAAGEVSPQYLCWSGGRAPGSSTQDPWVYLFHSQGAERTTEFIFYENQYCEVRLVEGTETFSRTGAAGGTCAIRNEIIAVYRGGTNNNRIARVWRKDPERGWRWIAPDSTPGLQQQQQQ